MEKQQENKGTKCKGAYPHLFHLVCVLSVEGGGRGGGPAAEWISFFAQVRVVTSRCDVVRATLRKAQYFCSQTLLLLRKLVSIFRLLHVKSPGFGVVLPHPRQLAEIAHVKPHASSLVFRVVLGTVFFCRQQTGRHCSMPVLDWRSPVFRFLPVPPSAVPGFVKFCRKLLAVPEPTTTSGKKREIFRRTTPLHS